MLYPTAIRGLAVVGIDGCAHANMHLVVFVYFFNHRVYFPAKLVGSFTLNELLDEPWSLVSTLSPPGITFFYFRMLSVLVREKTLGRKRDDLEESRLRAGCAGPTRGSAENNSRVVLARPSSDPFLSVHDLSRPVSFSSPPDPT